ncbi:hypothetical protein ACFE04_020706 [Oxalis oulophora]
MGSASAAVSTISSVEDSSDDQLQLGLTLSSSSSSSSSASTTTTTTTCSNNNNKLRVVADSLSSSQVVVGWPPIRASRINTVSHSITIRNSFFVKVNKDGVRIGRKVDLSAHTCYQTLAQMLEDMFFHPNANALRSSIKGGHSRLLDGSSEYVLTYEDKEGDWLLVGDVPWGMFLSSVKRLRIMKTSDATGLAPRTEERYGGTNLDYCKPI